MSEKPILFSAPMVRALLAGTKTQTRRVVKPQPERREIADVGNMLGFKKRHGDGFWLWPNARERILAECPYGQPGSKLWVRETWGVADKWLHDCETDPPRCIEYRADLAARNFDPVYDVDTSDWGFAPNMEWRPSIHMPRWASRITLEITGVRVERLQDISRGDAMAEGCPFPNMANGDDPRAWYADLWRGINGPGSWDANPWVWVVEFKRLEGAA